MSAWSRVPTGEEGSSRGSQTGGQEGRKPRVRTGGDWAAPADSSEQ